MINDPLLVPNKDKEYPLARSLESLLRDKRSVNTLLTRNQSYSVTRDNDSVILTSSDSSSSTSSGYQEPVSSSSTQSGYQEPVSSNKIVRELAETTIERLIDNELGTGQYKKLGLSQCLKMVSIPTGSLYNQLLDQLNYMVPTFGVIDYSLALYLLTQGGVDMKTTCVDVIGVA